MPGFDQRSITGLACLGCVMCDSNLDLNGDACWRVSTPARIYDVG